MEAPLALYEALLQANAPAALARDAAEKLERDMNTALAIRQDLQQQEAGIQLLDTKIEALRKETQAGFASLRSEMDSRFALVDERFTSLRQEMESRFAVMDERFVSLEQRIVIKLGLLMTVLIGAASGLQVLLG